MIDNELQKLKGKIDLSRQEMLDVMDLIMSGSLQDNEIEEFLMAMFIHWIGSVKTTWLKVDFQ